MGADGCRRRRRLSTRRRWWCEWQREWHRREGRPSEGPDGAASATGSAASGSSEAAASSAPACRLRHIHLSCRYACRLAPFSLLSSFLSHYWLWLSLTHSPLTTHSLYILELSFLFSAVQIPQSISFYIFSFLFPLSSFCILCSKTVFCIFPHPIMVVHALPCPALPCPALPCPALPCPRLSSNCHFP